MAISNPESRMIVIDTTSYAGNFERELCAYATGQYGECGVGAEIADAAGQEIAAIDWWAAHIVHEPDQNDTLRPVTIWPTPGWFNNGCGEHYLDDPANYDLAVDAAVDYLRRYHDEHNVSVKERIASRNFESGDKPGAWTEEACLRTLASSEAHIRQVAERRQRHPAFLSVAIFVDEFPPESVLEEMRARAELFCGRPQDFAPTFKYGEEKAIELTGFRLLHPSPTVDQTHSI